MNSCIVLGRKFLDNEISQEIKKILSLILIPELQKFHQREKILVQKEKLCTSLKNSLDIEK